MGGDFQQRFLQHLPAKVVISQIVIRVDKCKQRESGESDDEHLDKFLWHGWRQIETVQSKLPSRGASS